MGSVSRDPVDKLAQAQLKYEEERSRRLRADGPAQFVDATRSEKFKHFTNDPWYDPKTLPEGPKLSDNDHVRAIILGAGFGSLLFAADLIKSGISAENILLVDAASGFGGTWYWNRYPGLMCDVESACYMPLLEETGYTPKHKYSYGEELREYANLAARKLGIYSRASFRTSMKTASWDESTGEWITTIEKTTGNGNELLCIRCDFLVLAAGILVHPKLPLVPGIESFRGRIFHTARWDYDYTGGSPTDPSLHQLRDKRVAIIGTGATSIQIVPELAKWAKETYVFQRTPSSVAVRGQHPIDPGDFESVRKPGKGWQRSRQENMAAFLINPPQLPEVDLVKDGWTSFPTFSALVGSPLLKTLPVEKTPEYIAGLHALDLPRQEMIRARVDEHVKDKKTAEGLKPWYAGWCKRPGFHDEYLGAFNNPNVHLVDTAGKGIDEITETGLRFGEQHYDVDLVIFATGFEPWGQGSPAHRANITVTGRDGLSMDDKWADKVGTLHGVLTRGFPNLILPGGTQAGSTVNQVHQMGVYANHVGSIITAASRRAGPSEKVVLEPTEEGEEGWAREITSRAHGLAGLVNCTPSYINGEGKIATLSAEEKLKSARRANWTPGILDYTETIKAWEDAGDLAGLEVRVMPSRGSRDRTKL